MPEISIIVPIYNAEKHLPECIDSILGQSFTDFELLLVNDGSTDSSTDICNRYALTDKRIKVLNKKNGGVSSARNIGLDNASGNWIAFCDADDKLLPSFLEKLTRKDYTIYPLVVGYATICSKQGQVKENYPQKIVRQDNFQTVFTENDLHWHTSPWGKLFKRSIIENHSLRFDEKIHIGEDLIFLYTYLLYIDVFIITDHTDYLYQKDSEGSLTKRINTFDSELYTSLQVQCVINQLILSKRIVSQQALHNLQYIRGTYFRRVLIALYHTPLPKPKRINTLKQLCNHSLFIDYIERYDFSAWRENLLQWLLKNNMFRTYDFIRHSIIKYLNILHG